MLLLLPLRILPRGEVHLLWTRLAGVEMGAAICLRQCVTGGKNKRRPPAEKAKHQQGQESNGDQLLGGLDYGGRYIGGGGMLMRLRTGGGLLWRWFLRL